MKKLRVLTTHPGFKFLVLGLGLLLFSWPFGEHPTAGSGLFVYLFVAWGVLIALLIALVAGSTSTDSES